MRIGRRQNSENNPTKLGAMHDVRKSIEPDVSTRHHTKEPTALSGREAVSALAYQQSRAPKSDDFKGRGPTADNSTLIVGRNIQLKGEIKACDTLIVEGRTEASMDSRVIRILENGLFEGEAAVDTAEISGHFKGSLTARERLSVRATGKVEGTIRYGRLEVEDGGQAAGTLEVIDSHQKSATKLETAEMPKDKGAAAGSTSPKPTEMDSPVDRRLTLSS